MTRLGLTVLLLLAACGQPPAQDAAAPDGQGQTARAAALPDYLPDYPGSTRVEVPYLGAGPDRRRGHAIAMETDATPAEVAAFYRARFAEAGVRIGVDTANDEGGLIGVGRDGDASGAMLTITRSGGRTRIAVLSAGAGR